MKTLISNLIARKFAILRVRHLLKFICVMDNGHIEIAKEIMLNVACANGWVNRWEPMKYNEHWTNKLAGLAGRFFDKYPDLLNDDNLSEMCDGEVSEVWEKFGALDGFKELNDAIGKYFERGKA